MSGDELGKRGKAGGRKSVDAPKRAELRPVVLVPTLTQLAAGQRTVTADPEQYPLAVRQMVARAQKHGWGVHVTYSQFLDVPPVTGKYAGEWVLKHCLCVRLEHVQRGIRAYGNWIGTQDGGWSGDKAQAKLLNHGPTTAFGITALTGLVTGTMHIVTGEGVPYVAPIDASARAETG